MYHTDVVLKISATPFSHGVPMNVATVPGTMISDWAKMIGITPEELMRSGMNVFCPSRMRPRPMTLRGIWTGMRRAATVTATVPATTSTIIASTTSSTGKLSVPVLQRLERAQRLRPDALDDREEDQQAHARCRSRAR